MITEIAGKHRSLSVADFCEAGRTRLRMEVVAGRAGLRRAIHEPAINRPGLALSGFYEYFAHRRLQVLGQAENAFLASLPAAERSRRLRRLFESGIPCLAVTRNRKPPRELCDLAEEFGIALLKSTMVTLYFINEATVLMTELGAPQAIVEGSMVDIMGVGVLMLGKPGMGKSETALALVERGHSLVADEITRLRLDSDGLIIGEPMDVTRYHMEVKGLGIIHVPSLFGVSAVRLEKRLDLIANFSESADDAELEVVSGRRRGVKVLGVQVPAVCIPVAAGRDLANLVEVAALDHKLKCLGHDAVKELDAKLVEVMRGKGDGGD